MKKPLTVVVDTREKHPLPIASLAVEVRAAALACGDYALSIGAKKRPRVVVERKGTLDWRSSIATLDGKKRLESQLERLRKVAHPLLLIQLSPQYLSWPEQVWLRHPDRAEKMAFEMIKEAGIPVAFYETEQMGARLVVCWLRSHR